MKRTATVTITFVVDEFSTLGDAVGTVAEKLDAMKLNARVRGIKVGVSEETEELPQCKKHPKYQAKRKPYANCEDCWNIWLQLNSK